VRAFLAALFSVLAFSTSALATGFGVQCTPSASNQCGGGPAGIVAMAVALHAQILRVRVSIPHPIYDGGTYGSGTSSTLQADYDPILAANCTPDATGCPASLTACPGYLAYGLKMVSASGFTVGDTISTDFIPPGATLCAKSGSTIYTRTPPTAYVSIQKLNSNAFGPSGTIALAAAQGIAIDLTVFNSPSGGGAADGPILDQTGAICTTSGCDAMFEARVAYMLGQMAPVVPAVVSVGNEEDGGFSATCSDGVNPPTAPQSVCLVTLIYNGDYGDGGTSGDTDMHAYLQKLHDVCQEVHLISSAKCTDSGLMTVSTQLAFWRYEFEGVATTASQLEADIYQQAGFTKSAGQFSKQSKLPTSCNVFIPGLSNDAYARIARYMSILTDDAQVGPTHADLVNTHWYDVPWQTHVWALNWLATTAGKPIMANEIGAYSISAVDALQKIIGARRAKLVWAEWWNEESSGNAVLARALSDPYSGTVVSQVPLRGNGQAWVSYLTTNQPNVLTGTSMPLPFNCGS
jgi:hypothetical protein